MDTNFVGYTYKNFEIVDEHHMPGIAELKKKNNKPKRPSIKSLFDTPDPPDPSVQGNSSHRLPNQLGASEGSQPSRQSARPPQHQHKPPRR